MELYVIVEYYCHIFRLEQKLELLDRDSYNLLPTRLKLKILTLTNKASL